VAQAEQVAEALVVVPAPPTELLVLVTQVVEAAVLVRLVVLAVLAVLGLS
jgi:hypothetical protein